MGAIDLSEVTGTPEMLREKGKMLLIEGDREKRATAFACIIKAHEMGDTEASFYVADCILKGILSPKEGDREEVALSILTGIADKGDVQARTKLNEYCRKRYERKVNVEKPGNSGPLTDFDGKVIKINRTGLLTPIDAVLEYRDGKNYLTFSVNVLVLDSGIENPDILNKAVIDGIKEWEGDYLVFGNQLLRVNINVTQDDRLFDSVIIMPVDTETGESYTRMYDKLPSTDNTKRMESIIKSKRSFAFQGLKWSTRSRKYIYLFSEDDNFDDYYEILHIVKHEFGHALGLGDLYDSKSDFLEGVEKGKFYELDGYYVTDNIYNLVMCDYHGPISNNDIEMVVLAFSENKMQLYQPFRKNKKLSKALGRGN